MTREQAEQKYNNDRFDSVGRLVTDNGKIRAIVESEAKAHTWARFLNKIHKIRQVAVQRAENDQSAQRKTA